MRLRVFIDTRNPGAIRARYPRTCGACCEKLSHFGPGRNTRDAADRVWGVSHRFADLSPESSYVNVFSTDLSLFDTLEIQYIIHWSIDKKLLRHEI